MADTLNLEQPNSAAFAQYLGFYRGYFQMSYHEISPEHQRIMAVACALELINGQSAGGTFNSVGGHLNQLGAYADLIQEALKVNNK
ncbi:hypothetical protein ACQ2HG_11370 [Aeromonas hydrophila]|uniref:hypothetical protein n=1 Tax=Aeromonas hydrophila TaxID=644 RepID=UPI003D317E4C